MTFEITYRAPGHRLFTRVIEHREYGRAIEIGKSQVAREEKVPRYELCVHHSRVVPQPAEKGRSE